MCSGVGLRMVSTRRQSAVSLKFDVGTIGFGEEKGEGYMEGLIVWGSVGKGKAAGRTPGGRRHSSSMTTGYIRERG